VEAFSGFGGVQTIGCWHGEFQVGLSCVSFCVFDAFSRLFLVIKGFIRHSNQLMNVVAPLDRRANNELVSWCHFASSDHDLFHVSGVTQSLFSIDCIKFSLFQLPSFNPAFALDRFDTFGWG